MSILNQFNSGHGFEYDKEVEREFINFKELYEKVGDKPVVVRALFINTKGHYGNAPVIVSDTHMINAPQHMLEVVQGMRETQEVVEMVNQGRVGLKLYEYTNKYGKAVGGEWVEL